MNIFAREVYIYEITIKNFKILQCILQVSRFAYSQLRARRALSLFKDVPLTTRRALAP